MLNPFIDRDGGLRPSRLVICAGLLMFAALLGTSVNIDDPFHQGEYFAAAQALIAGLPMPLAIHGALDVLPALAAYALWGPDTHFLPTAALYQALDWLACVVFLLVAWHCATRPPRITAGTGLRASLAPLPAWLAVSLTLAAPLLVGVRDLALLITLGLFLANLQVNASNWQRLLLRVLLGAMQALGLVWSFDRGIAAMAAFGIAVLYLAWRDRTYLMAIASFALTLTCLWLFSPLFSPHQYLASVLVLAQTSSEWSYGTRKRNVVLWVVAGNAIALGLLLRATWQQRRQPVSAPDGQAERCNELARCAALVTLGLFMAKIATNRADHQHAYWGLWVPMLAILEVRHTLMRSARLVSWTTALLAIAATALAFKRWRLDALLLAAPLAWALLPPPTTGRQGRRRLLGQLMTTLAIVLPAVFVYRTQSVRDAPQARSWWQALVEPVHNAKASPQPLTWVSSQMSASKSACLFDFTNQGLLNGLTQLAPCTRFSYPVYAGRRHQDEIIESLQATRPNAIVYSTHHWSYAIDGKSMPQRLPDLDRYLRTQFPIERCQAGYCVRWSQGAQAPLQ